MRKLRIGLDAMGGDFAPGNEVSGALEALERSGGGFEVYLFGDEKAITGACDRMGCSPGNFVIVHCPDRITFEDHPAMSVTGKTQSSLVRGFDMLASGEIDAFAGTGNTGAMMTACCTRLSLVHGVHRPCISVELPGLSGQRILLLDVGFNAECRPEQYCHFAWLGSVYARSVFGVREPRVALLNIGGESGKGHIIAREAWRLMSDTQDYRFVGNIEPDTLFTTDRTDVVVTDGFTGNIFLKQAEGFYEIASARGIHDPYIDRFNYEEYGGTPVLGVSSTVIIGHGRSTPRAIANMILKAENVLNCGLIENFNIFAR